MNTFLCYFNIPTFTPHITFMNRIGRYQDGVTKAKEAGNIKMNFSTSDNYSHSIGITPFNSRGLTAVAKKILQAWPDPKPKKVLEIGPGCMAAASAISLLVPEAKIHTAGGLTPANPYWRFSEDILFGDGSRITVADTVKDKLIKISAPESDKTFHSPDDLMAIQQKYGIKIFDVLEKPYIELQCVDQFPDYCSLQKGDYDFVYENCGPNWHLKTEELAWASYNLVSPGGILCMNSVSPLDRYNELEAPFVIQLESWNLTVNKDNFLEEHIRGQRRQGQEFSYNDLDKIRLS